MHAASLTSAEVSVVELVVLRADHGRWMLPAIAASSRWRSPVAVT
jgi:hypothetical protein